ncbi:MAG: hypothetical protein LQ349_000638 [Xanthoria aureola]|nr:MAG: hypothetical protein LQ349_000638 [Xanthoria aureola]
MPSILALIFLSLLSTALAHTVAPYPISNSTTPAFPTGPTGTSPPTSTYSTITTTSTSECPPPVTITVTETVTTSAVIPFPTGTGTGGTAAPTGTAGPSASAAYYRRPLDMRGLNYREGQVGYSQGYNEKRVIVSPPDPAASIHRIPPSGMYRGVQLVFVEGYDPRTFFNLSPWNIAVPFWCITFISSQLSSHGWSEG